MALLITSVTPEHTLSARRFLEELPRKILRCRWLPHVSPLAESWTQGSGQLVVVGAKA